MKQLRIRTFGNFVAQQLLSTVGAMMAGIVAAAIPAMAIALVTKNNSGGNWIDHTVSQPILRATGEPLFVFPIFAGILFGFLSWRRRWSSSALWVWVLPLVNLVFNVFTWRTGGFHQYWPDVWNNFFGSQCGSSECAYEVFVTAPTYTSAAYALGYALARKRSRNHREPVCSVAGPRACTPHVDRSIADYSIVHYVCSYRVTGWRLPFLAESRLRSGKRRQAFNQA